MPGWTLIDTHPTQGRTFQRLLRGTELGFFWDGHFAGTADNLYHAELRLLNAPRDAQLFSEANITRAWLSTKRRYPLSGAIVKMLSESGDGVSLEPHFVVREHDLVSLRPHEITSGLLASAKEVPQQISAIWEGPRPLSNELLMKLYVFRESDILRADILHLIVLTAHCITDGMANRTFMRCFLDTLARGGDPEAAQVPLEDRLAAATSYEDLEPVHQRLLSPARLRWRRAICAVILMSQMARFTQGGHTLPRRVTRATSRNPSRPGFISSLLTQEQTASVIANCRLHGLTFGSAYAALAQVAMTRVLYRRYLRGEISEEEWTYRKRQPYRIMVPLNLRPYLDKAWFERGGGGEFMVSMNISLNSLPFMTLGETERPQHRKRLLDGAPPFSDLLTFERFLYRAGLAKKQTRAFIDHPLFFEYMRMRISLFVPISRLLALEHAKKSCKTANGSGDEDDEKVLAVSDMNMVLSGVGSLGNVDVICPNEFPLPPTHPLSPLSTTPHPARAGYSTTPLPMEDTGRKIVVENAMTQLHTRPTELYLSALTARERLNMYVSYDANVYEKEVVTEWLDEVRGAVLWYLGQTHRSRVDRGAQINGSE